MIKRIGILTFHASHNYGSMLQAYALQTFLEKQGYEVTVINLRGLAQKFYYIKPGQLLKKETLKAFVRHPKLFIQLIGKWYKFERFMKNYYHLSHELVDLVSTEKAINEVLELDAVITGGDQIWNMNCLDFSLSYFLPFETPGIRRIAYAPSFGDEQWWRPRNYLNVLRALVSGYDFPSVREKSSSDLLSDLLDCPVPCVPDPVFLLHRQDYLSMVGEKPLIKGDYIFYYSPRPDDVIAGYVGKMSQQFGYKVVTSVNGEEKERCFESFCNAGPIEFLNLMKNASVVCGRSMHLVAFSLLLHKPFYVISRSESARIGHLLDEVGLSNRFIRIETDSLTVDRKPIDWEEVDRRLDSLRNTGYDFLHEALS